MPGPKVMPCGGPGQPSCPPENAIAVNIGQVLETPDGQKHVVVEDDDDNDTDTE